MLGSKVPTLSRVYLAAVLLAGIILCPLLYSAISLFLFLLLLYSLYKPRSAELNLLVHLPLLILLPQVWEPLIGIFLSVALVIPALPLVDHDLRQNAPRYASAEVMPGRKTTPALEALGAALLVVLLISVILTNLGLMFTVILLLAYLLGVLAYTLFAIPRRPLQESRSPARMIAGDRVEVTSAISNKARSSLHVSLRPLHPWLSVEPAKLFGLLKETKLTLTLNPPLAGTTTPGLEATIVDPWGLTFRRQTLEPVELFVSPRAKYAEWLAKKYLELTTPGAAVTAVTLPAYQVFRGVRHGVEYYNTRLFQPGDRPKDIDWKHTIKLHELAVKEHIEPQGQGVVMVVNLTAGGMEEADRLAYNLIVSALTVAREGAPIALTAYNHEEVVTATPMLNSREALKRALKLVRNITEVELPQRFLDPPDLRGIRRALNQLQQIESEPGQRLKELLSWEYQVIYQTAETHPAVKGLAETLEHVPPPATIMVLSAWSHDVEALLVTLERLERKGYKVLRVETAKKAMPGPRVSGLKAR
jgi:uncharacterized protein (DUF58 family)